MMIKTTGKEEKRLMKVQIRSDSVEIDGYVNAVARDSRPIKDKKNGGTFIEQIVPKAFERALANTDEVKLLLNHDDNRMLGSTKSNLELYEDSIGLRAHAIVTDAEVIEKARRHELRGWSFGFIPTEVSEEDMPDGRQRRFVENMDLKEVSIIDSRKLPCYAGTLIETRAEGDTAIADTLEVRTEYTEEPKAPADLAGFKARIAALEH
jgi:uncharacterized protein